MLPLERRLPLIVLVLFMIVLAVSLAISYYEIRTSALELAAERLSGLSRSLATMIETQAANRGAIMRRVARDSAVQQMLRSPDGRPSPAALKALSALITTPGDTNTRPELWNAAGEPIGRVRLETPVERQRFGAELLGLRASADSFRIAPIRVANGRASYYDIVPVRAADSLLGFVVQERRIATNPRALQPLRGLIGSDIEFFVRNASDKTWVQLSGGSVPPPTASEPALDSLDVFTHAGSGSSLAATSPVRGSPLIVTVERPMKAILAKPRATIRVLILIGLVLALLGAVAVWIVSRRLVRPLGDLTTAAEAIAHGEYAQRVGVAGGDEIGRLGAAFNRMAHEVQASSETSKQALTRLTRAIEVQEFLAEASRILSGSVSDDTLLTDLARFCVPKLADYCTIHVADPDGTIRRIETAHRDPVKLHAVRELVKRYRYRVDGPGEVALVIRTQKPLVVPHLDLDGIRRAAPDDDARRLLDEVRPASFMCVPLVARGHAIGAMSFTMTESGRTFGPEDADLASELARRTAMAIDNAVIYRRSVALRLEAEAASNAKSDFLAKMSHEIRTPINAMMGYAELILMGISGPVSDVQAKQLERIRASGDHLTSLINEILDLAKIEAGRMSLEATRGVAGDAIDAAIATVRPIAATKGVELVAAVAGRPDIEYMGDPKRVQQILNNLLSNAVKFTPAGGRVAVDCNVGSRPHIAGSDAAADWACLTVHDTGVGIGPGDLERIFQPFVQVDSGYTRTQDGTGLGLTISRNLAQMMGGEITVESTPGHGSSFTLWLPCPIRALASA